MTTLDDVLAKAQPATQSVSLCLRGDLTNKIEELIVVRDLLAAGDEMENRDPKAPEVEEEILRLQAEAIDSSATFTLQAIGAHEWNKMLAKHPPSKQDLLLGRDFDPLTFPHEAVSKSLTEPTGVTPPKVRELEKAMSAGQWMQLWTVCLAVNLGGGDIPKFVTLSAARAVSENKQKSAALTESPGASS